ncbi:AMP-binding protein [Shimia ponticola]|uniref:AMP-binding protein n=1 Tax=Shimia ponticola TaxID=2582893 RepID=UPI0021076DB2|nr:AMP-binding protein [Shimia ponticola]
MTLPRLLTVGDTWDEVTHAFSWQVPADFSMLEACLSRWSRETPDALAVRDIPRGEDWTFAGLADASARFASVLGARGIGRGDRVAVLAPQGVEVLISHFACYRLGAIAVPMFALFGGEALSYRLTDAGVAAVICDPARRATVEDVLATNGVIAAVWDTSDASFWHELAVAAPMKACADIGAEDPAVMIYTSGTTGPPKGVLHAHRFLLGHLPSFELHHHGLSTDDIGWTPADWAWIGGLMDMAMPCLFYGLPVIAQRYAKFDPAAAMQLIADQKVTRLFLPPTAMKLMQTVPAPEGMQVRSVSSGGEALTPDILNWGQEALSAPINEIYGQTECNLSVVSSADLGVQRVGWMGRAVPGFRIEVMQDGKAVPDGTVGELCVHRDTPSTFLRYWNKSEATEVKFWGDWLRTGDLVRREGDYFQYVARDDDLISSAGYRVGPTEIEACLCDDPAVQMAAVVGVPDAIKGQAIRAFVTVAGAEPDDLEARLKDRVRSRLSPHLTPREVVVIEAMPLTATGKVLRRELRDRAVD